jgi:hypothetical protein
MLFTFHIQKMDQRSGAVGPVVLPLTLDLSSVEMARVVVSKIVAHRDVAAHSVRIVSEDGAVSERWFWLDGEWRQKPA